MLSNGYLLKKLKKKFDILNFLHQTKTTYIYLQVGKQRQIIKKNAPIVFGTSVFCIPITKIHLLFPTPIKSQEKMKNQPNSPTPISHKGTSSILTK
jgi:hypothetical protein